MVNEFISEEMAIVIKKIAEEHPDTIFCGSLALVINGKLHREVKDIDVLVQKNFYKEGSFFNNLRVSEVSDSHEFMVGKDVVKSFKLHFPVFDKKISVDVLYNQYSKSVFEYTNFDGVEIKIETPEAAIKAKLLYIANDKSEISVVKHLKDLIYLEADKDLLIDAIDRSGLGGNPENYKPLKATNDNEDDLPF